MPFFCYIIDGSTKQVYPYGITSLSDKKDFLQKGDTVKFQIAVVKDSGKTRATNIAAVRKYQHAKVDSIKGQVSCVFIPFNE